jgi:hypothetical protein
MNLFDSAVVTVSQTRYDELLHKEAMLDNIKALHVKTTDYLFRDVVGYLLKADAQTKQTENANE